MLLLLVLEAQVAQTIQPQQMEVPALIHYLVRMLRLLWEVEAVALNLEL
jgi:hypothetical protein